jgi:hypothetical protein
VEVQFHSFLTSALHRGEWQSAHTGRFILEERHTSTAVIWVWVGPTACLGGPHSLSRWTPQPVWNFLKDRQVSFYVTLFTPCILLHSICNTTKHSKTNHTTHFIWGTNSNMFRHQGAILRELNNNRGPSVQHVLQVLVALTFRGDTVQPVMRCVVRSAGRDPCESYIVAVFVCKTQKV